jgi:hypothetical protein
MVTSAAVTGRRARHVSAAVAMSLAVAWTTAGCAARSFQPSVATRARAAAFATYRGELRVEVDGPSLKGHARTLLAFRRPDALRLEVPGPAGARLIAVAVESSLTAVFPGERAFYQGTPDVATMEGLLGVALSPPELMDLLVGAGAERVRDYEVFWDADRSLPRRFRAELADGTRLDVRAERAEGDCILPERAFALPPVAGLRMLSLAEARNVWSR